MHEEGSETEWGWVTQAQCSILRNINDLCLNGSGSGESSAQNLAKKVQRTNNPKLQAVLNITQFPNFPHWQNAANLILHHPMHARVILRVKLVPIAIFSNLLVII